MDTGETVRSPSRPRYYGGINWPGLSRMELFWSRDTSIEPVPVRDIYKLEFDLFSSFGWVVWYQFCACIFLTHAALGWQKLVPAPSMAIPKAQQNKVGMAMLGAGTITFFGTGGR